MPRDTKKSTQAADDNGSYHMVECTGGGCDGNGCIVWSRIWLPERIPKNFLTRPFLCGFCAHDKIAETGTPQLEGRARFEADAMQQYGRRDNVRIVGLDDGGSNEDPYEEVIKVACYCGVNVKRDDISVCHRLPSRNGGKRPLIARFVRREKKIELMRNKKNLKSHSVNIYLNDDVTPLRSKILFFVTQRPYHQICPVGE